MILAILGTNLFVLVLNFGSSILLARTLGPEGRGRLATMQIWTMMLHWLVSGGLTAAVIHFTAKEVRQRTTAVGNATVCGFLIGLVVMGIGLVLAQKVLPLQPIDRLTLSLAFCLMPLHALLDLVSVTMNGLGRLDIVNRMRFWRTVVGVTALGVAAALHGLTPPVAFWCVWLATWVGWPFIYQVLRQNAMWRFEVSWSVIQQWWRYSIPCTLTSNMTTALLRFDQMLMTVMVNDKQRGLYALSVALSELLLQVPAAVSLALFPNSSQSDIGEEAKIATAARLVRLTLVVVSVGGVLGAILLPTLAPFLFGNRFREMIPSYLLLLPGTLALAVANPIVALLQGQARPWLVVMPQALSMGIGLPLLLFVLPKWGIIGAALVSSLTYGIFCLGILGMLTRHIGWKATRTFLPTRQMLTNGELRWQRLLRR